MFFSHHFSFSFFFGLSFVFPKKNSFFFFRFWFFSSFLGRRFFGFLFDVFSDPVRNERLFCFFFFFLDVAFCVGGMFVAPEVLDSVIVVVVVGRRRRRRCRL